MLPAAVMHELVPQLLHDSAEHRKRPAPFEDPFRRLTVHRLVFISFFTARYLKGQNRPAATLLGATAIHIIGQEELD